MTKSPELPKSPTGPDDSFQTINPPLHRASTVLYDTYDAFVEANRPPYHGKIYGTFGSPVQLELEAALAAISGGHRSLVCHSGFDAIAVVLMAFTKSGDHIVVSDNVYGPTRDFCERVLKKYGVAVDYLPPTVGADVESFLKPETKLIYLESPGSNTFEIADVPAVVSVARERGIVTALDNTWATPLHFDAFAHGIDITVQSGSKYLSGHSDVLLGTLTANDERFDELYSFYEATERFAAPESCYRALKGMRTLGVRLERQQATALSHATWLEAHPAVSKMLYPALESHPEHSIWKRDFTGAAAVFAFVLKREMDDEAIAAFVDPMRHFRLGLSWGGFQSLVQVSPKGHHSNRAHPSRYADDVVIRLSVGLEDEAELREDLEEAIERVT